MTKEDYMRLPKERLAELLAERDSAPPAIINPLITLPRPQCWEEGGTCSNPFHDCVNCPRRGSSGGIVTKTEGTYTTTTNTE